MSHSRKLAAIMFTDIAGYTRLMQESEDRANQLRERHRQVFEHFHNLYQGNVLQYYGDGTLSIFDSCVEAVRCAIDLQRELRKTPAVPLRIGIHLGDIVLAQNDVYGDGVSVASRVESLGVPGAVLISGEVRRQIKNQEVETVSMGRFEMKNVEMPVEVFAVKASGILVPKPKNLKGQPAFSEVVGARYWIEGYFFREGDSLTVKSHLTNGLTGDVVRNFPDI
jgi:adenylate cyclase